MALFMEEWQVITSINPVADAFAGTPTVDIIDMAEFEEFVAIQHTGVGTTGTSTITVEACDDISASNTTAVAFYSQSDTSADTEGAITARTMTGYANTAGSNRREIVSCKASAFAASGYRYARVKFVESVDNPVLGGILILGRRKVQRSAPKISAVD